MNEGSISSEFRVLEPEALDFINGDNTHFETQLLERLTAAGQRLAYRHITVQQRMDTLHERRYSECLWESGKAAWETRPVCVLPDAKMNPQGLYRSSAVRAGSGT